MKFDPTAYGTEVARILALDGDGERLMPLAMGTCSNREAARLIGAASARELFPAARSAEAALSGLWLYFSCLDESHSLSQEILIPDGSFWHGIMHRQEPDAGNSSYWFRRVGRHPIFEKLASEADGLVREHPEAAFSVGDRWDPLAFIEFCERARKKPGSEDEQLALEIQRVEWQLLFDHCAGR
jgi:hypothetical protein